MRQSTRHRRLALLTAGAALALAAGAVTSPASAAPTPCPARIDLAKSYDLPEAPTYLEGVGVDRRAGVVYVSATNRDGTVYRGRIGSGRLEVWQGPTPGANGRGIDVDEHGRVFVAGGPTGAVRVFARSGALLATLPTGAAGAFLNDVFVAPDGTAYVTDSSLPVIWRVTHHHGTWAIQRWLDVSGTVTYTPSLADFDLGGITITRDGRTLLTTQGTTGQVWRVDLRTRRISEVAVDGAPVVNADGIVLRGHRLVVVQNFSRQITTLRLSGDLRSASTVQVRTTPTDRTFTTAKQVDGRLLVVDSKFGFPPAAAVAEDRLVAVRI